MAEVLLGRTGGNGAARECAPASSDADGARSSTSRPRAQAPRLEALDAPRWIASIQIVFSHFYIDSQRGRAHPIAPPGPGEWWYQFALYGKNWTQFFFMLSGFVLAYSEMARPQQSRTKMTQLQYLRRRLITIYPTYLLALLAGLLQARQLGSITDFQWKTLPLSLLLMQSWVVVCGDMSGGMYVCSSYTWNVPAWFLSALVVYWLILRPVAGFFRNRGLVSSCVCLCGLWAFSLVPGIIAKSLPEPISQQCMLYQLQNGSLGYFHVFVAGVAVARIFILTCLKDDETGEAPTATTEHLALAPERAPLIARYGCCIGYGAYALYFVFVDMEIMLYFFHNGGIIPIMTLIILGCAMGLDPIARHVFQTRLLRTLGQLSYAQYLMQMPLFMFFWGLLEGPHSPASQKGLPPGLPLTTKIVFPFALVAVGYFVQRYVQRPYTEWQRWRAEKGVKGTDERLVAWMDGVLDACWERCGRAVAMACPPRGSAAVGPAAAESSAAAQDGLVGRAV